MIGFLLQTNVAKAHQLAGEIYQREPRNSGFLSTRAYSLHLQGKDDEAIKLFQNLKPAELENPSTAAYYVIVLSQTGDFATAKKYLPFAEKASLLPEEEKLFLTAKSALK